MPPAPVTWNDVACAPSTSIVAVAVHDAMLIGDCRPSPAMFSRNRIGRRATGRSGIAVSDALTITARGPRIGTVHTYPAEKRGIVPAVAATDVAVRTPAATTAAVVIPPNDSIIRASLL